MWICGRILGGSWYSLTKYNCTDNCTNNHIRAFSGASKWIITTVINRLISTMNLQVSPRRAGHAGASAEPRTPARAPAARAAPRAPAAAGPSSPGFRVRVSGLGFRD